MDLRENPGDLNIFYYHCIGLCVIALWATIPLLVLLYLLLMGSTVDNPVLVGVIGCLAGILGCGGESGNMSSAICNRGEVVLVEKAYQSADDGMYLALAGRIGKYLTKQNSICTDGTLLRRYSKPYVLAPLKLWVMGANS